MHVRHQGFGIELSVHREVGGDSTLGQQEAARDEDSRCPAGVGFLLRGCKGTPHCSEEAPHLASFGSLGHKVFVGHDTRFARELPGVPLSGGP